LLVEKEAKKAEKKAKFDEKQAKLVCHVGGYWLMIESGCCCSSFGFKKGRQEEEGCRGQGYDLQ